MKKYIAILCVTALLMALCAGCDSKEPAEAPTTVLTAVPADPTAAPTVAPTAAQDNLYFTYSGTKVMLDMPAEGLLSQLPEPKHYTESASCAFEGLDKTYDYGSFALQTYPAKDGERVFGFWFQDDTVTTAEGAYIGMTPDQVAQLYPSATMDEEVCILEQGNCRLTIAFQDGLVSSIQYAVKL